MKEDIIQVTYICEECGEKDPCILKLKYCFEEPTKCPFECKSKWMSLYEDKNETP